MKPMNDAIMTQVAESAPCLVPCPRCNYWRTDGCDWCGGLPFDVSAMPRVVADLADEIASVIFESVDTDAVVIR